MCSMCMPGAHRSQKGCGSPKLELGKVAEQHGVSANQTRALTKPLLQRTFSLSEMRGHLLLYKSFSNSLYVRNSSGLL